MICSLKWAIVRKKILIRWFTNEVWIESVSTHNPWPYLSRLTLRAHLAFTKIALALFLSSSFTLQKSLAVRHELFVADSRSAARSGQNGQNSYHSEAFATLISFVVICGFLFCSNSLSCPNKVVFLVMLRSYSTNFLFNLKITSLHLILNWSSRRRRRATRHLPTYRYSKTCFSSHVRRATVLFKRFIRAFCETVNLG